MFVGWLQKPLVVLQRKLNSMRKSAIKEQIYGAIIEMMSNRDLYFKSEIGRNHEYSHWTEAGQEELLAFMIEYSRRMLVAEEAEIDSRAKEMTFAGLKK